jgi:hypothetical protein
MVIPAHTGFGVQNLSLFLSVLKHLFLLQLYARRLDQSIGIVSNQVERLAVEPVSLFSFCENISYNESNRK